MLNKIKPAKNTRIADEGHARQKRASFSRLFLRRKGEGRAVLPSATEAKPNRFLFSSLAFFFFALCGTFFSCEAKSQFALGINTADGVQSETLSERSSGSVRYWRFSSAQKEAIRSYSERESKTAALLIQIFVRKAESSGFSDKIGFLYEEDFSTRGKILQDTIGGTVVLCDFSEFEGACFAVLFSFANQNSSSRPPRSSSFPEGFYIDSSDSYSVVSAEIVSAAIGFDFRKDVPLYAFANNGGKLTLSPSSIDISGLSLSFSPANSERAMLPQISVSFFAERETKSDESADSESAGSEENSASSPAQSIKLTAGGEQITIRRDSSSDEHVIPVSALRDSSSAMTIELSDSATVSALIVRASEPSLLRRASEESRDYIVPIKTDPGLIMSWPKSNWRGKDYELFEWDRFAGVLFFDTADYAVQDDFFRRLAYFVEKQGFTGTLLTDEQLKGQHGYNAHDYRAESLAEFFEAARESSFSLNARELLLRRILLENGVIAQAADGSFASGKGAVISISRESPLYLRSMFVAHEGWHGIFFVDSDFQNAVASVYYTLQVSDPMTMAFLKRYFQVTPTLNYDTNDDYLMKNEFASYMLQRPVNQVAEYYVNMASRSHAQTTIKKEADHIIQTRASGFVSAAQMLESYVSERWNLEAGRVWLLSR